jgi:hypothetical protein
MKQKVKELVKNWTWTPAKAGVVIGFAILAGYFFYNPMGLCVGCAIGNTLSWMEHSTTSNAILFPGIPTSFQTPIIGLFLGALIGAIRAKEFRIRGAKPKFFVISFLGGILISFGNFVAGGCPIRHGIVGIGGLAIESWIAFPAMIVGILIGVLILKRVAK